MIEDIDFERKLHENTLKNKNPNILKLLIHNNIINFLDLLVDLTNI